MNFSKQCMVLKGNLYEMLTQEDNLTRDCRYNRDHVVRYTSYTHYCPHQKQSVYIFLKEVGRRYELHVPIVRGLGITLDQEPTFCSAYSPPLSRFILPIAPAPHCYYLSYLIV